MYIFMYIIFWWFNETHLILKEITLKLKYPGHKLRYKAKFSTKEICGKRSSKRTGSNGHFRLTCGMHVLQMRGLFLGLPFGALETFFFYYYFFICNQTYIKKKKKNPTTNTTATSPEAEWPYRYKTLCQGKQKRIRLKKHIKNKRKEKENRFTLVWLGHQALGNKMVVLGWTTPLTANIHGQSKYRSWLVYCQCFYRNIFF